MSYTDHLKLIKSLCSSACYRHPVDKINVIETHISSVILTGEFAYKIKKPVNLGFLDFSSLYRRHRFCDLEVNLNKRSAENLYLSVVPITGTIDYPVVDGKGEPIEYAVKMRQFDQDCQLDCMLANNKLSSTHIDAVAVAISKFHTQIKTADKNSDFGTPQLILQPVQENFEQLKDAGVADQLGSLVNDLEIWSKSTYTSLEPVFLKRKQNGKIKECHGDLHLANLAWIDNTPVAFDCIEFNDSLRWIDVMSDLAFLIMDLEDRDNYRFANRLLNAYLEITGDYEGIKVLRFYKMYRAMVRAKVDAIRMKQKEIDIKEKQNIQSDMGKYLELACSYAQVRQPKLIITHGPSASGKSTLSQKLLEKIGTIRIRSDVERKRMLQGGPKSMGRNLYTSELSVRTYDKLLELARTILEAGTSVIVDATFQEIAFRQKFQQLAQDLSVSYVILDLHTPESVLHDRIVKRHNDISDADFHVLENQLKNWTEIESSEQRYALKIDTESITSSDSLDELSKMILM